MKHMYYQRLQVGHLSLKFHVFFDYACQLENRLHNNINECAWECASASSTLAYAYENQKIKIDV